MQSKQSKKKCKFTHFLPAAIHALPAEKVGVALAFPWTVVALVLAEQQFAVAVVLLMMVPSWRECWQPKVTPDCPSGRSIGCSRRTHWPCAGQLSRAVAFPHVPTHSPLTDFPTMQRWPSAVGAALRPEGRHHFCALPSPNCQGLFFVHFAKKVVGFSDRMACPENRHPGKDCVWPKCKLGHSIADGRLWSRTERGAKLKSF